MTKIVKLIFKFDFEPNFDVMDYQGTVLKCLNSYEKNFWDSLNESVNTRSSKVVYSRQNLYRDITVDPTSINGSLEVPEGIDINNIKKSESFIGINKTVDAFLNEFNIYNMRRAGLRLFVLDGYGEKFENPLKKFLSFFNKDFLDNFNQDIGIIEDAGILFDGISHDNINYHVNAGCFYLDDLRKFLNNTSVTDDIYQELKASHFIADIDMYENNISIKGTDFMRWAKDKWPFAENVMKLCRKQMLGIE